MTTPSNQTQLKVVQCRIPISYFLLVIPIIVVLPGGTVELIVESLVQNYIVCFTILEMV